MKVVAWNVNSVRAREARLLAFLERHQPDVVCLQELKVEDGAFPSLHLREAGYQAAVHGQKTYNGVAVLSRVAPLEVVYGMADGDPDPQARVITASVGALRVVSVYVPNGSTPDSDKYQYKLRFLERFRDYLGRLTRTGASVVVCGDFNITRDDADVARPAEWADSVLCRPEVRQWLRGLDELGLVDLLRAHHPEGSIYSWWDYRQLGFQKNNGLRIDYVLASADLAARCSSVQVDRDERKGASPSDHAPVIAEFGD